MPSTSVMLTEYDVPRRPLSVQLRLHDRAHLKVHLFPATVAARRAGEEGLEDLLNGPDDFLPARCARTGDAMVVHRASIVLARSEEAEPLSLSHWLAPDSTPVEVVLLDGSAVEGRLRSFASPSGHPSQVLNAPAPFLPLEEPGGMVLVNKRYVARLVARES